MTKLIGFTGTRYGMTPNQKKKVYEILLQHKRQGAKFHHGDCRGADVQAAQIAHVLRYRTIAHPGPTDSVNFVSDETCDEKPFLERNRDIVDFTQLLIAAPRTAQEELRSGTWATVRYARKTGKKVIVVQS